MDKKIVFLHELGNNLTDFSLYIPVQHDKMIRAET